MSWPYTVVQRQPCYSVLLSVSEAVVRQHVALCKGKSSDQAHDTWSTAGSTAKELCVKALSPMLLGGIVVESGHQLLGGSGHAMCSFFPHAMPMCCS